MLELLDTDEKTSPDDHWRFVRDVKNTMAQRLAPIMAEALAEHEDTAHLAAILGDWDYVDDKEAIAPTIFQTVYRHFAILTYTDDLGDDLAKQMLDTWYFWHESLAKFVVEQPQAWIFDVITIFDVFSLGIIKNLSLWWNSRKLGFLMIPKLKTSKIVMTCFIKRPYWRLINCRPNLGTILRGGNGASCIPFPSLVP